MAVNLATKDVHEYLLENLQPDIFKLVLGIENRETHVYDKEPEFADLLTSISNNIDNLANLDLENSQVCDDLITFLAHLSLGKIIRCLDYIDEIDYHFTNNLINYAKEHSKEPTDIYNLFLEKNIIFEKIQIVSRTFHNDRFKEILDAMEELEE